MRDASARGGVRGRTRNGHTMKRAQLAGVLPHSGPAWRSEALLLASLAAEPDFRAAAVKEIREASPVLFEDTEAVRECERIFEELIEEARSR